MNITNLNSFTPDAQHKYLFDTNIWLYLYCPIGNYNQSRVAIYSNFLKLILNLRCDILLSSLILSEFFNAYIKLEFHLLQKQNPGKYNNFKKDFRNTTDYINKFNNIKSIAKNNLLKITKNIDDQFGSINFDNLLSEMEMVDFNDKYYITLADTDKYMIVTDDKDFSKVSNNINILTANPNLI